MAKHNKRGVKKRVFSPPRAGDPGPPLPVHLTQPMPSNVDLDLLDTRQLLQLALQVGIDAKAVCELKTCAQHAAMKRVTESFANSKNYGKYVSGIDMLYCDKCWSWFREVKPLS